MRDNLRATVWRLAVFVGFCLVGALALVMVFAQLRVEGGEKSYKAVFTTVSGLSGGNFVRIAGVEVGRSSTFPSTTTATPWSSSGSTTRWC